MTQQQMQLLVPRKLQEIEREYGIRVLYAAESGSRAWGTHTETSDFDVRFIYIRPAEDYLRLAPPRDVLEFPISDGWDMCGWDLTKTLQLLRSANSQIYEWFASPVVYVDDGLSQRIRPLLDACFSAPTMVRHYLHQSDLKGRKRQKTDTPRVKHYLYSLQHTAAARWVLQHRAPVPVSFHTIVRQLPQDMRDQAYELLERKTTRPDQPCIPHRPELEAWLTLQMEQIAGEVRTLPPTPETDWQMLDSFFLAELKRTES